MLKGIYVIRTLTVICLITIASNALGADFSGIVTPSLEREVGKLLAEEIEEEGNIKTVEDERLNRARSALFWEERNCWYSDIWKMAGVRQRLDGSTERGRSAAFPFELAYRIINMYSIRGECVFDPFLGTGTTLFAAMASCRNSIGLELDRSFLESILARVDTAVEELNGYLSTRLEAHMHFVEDYEKRKKALRHRNIHYGFPVMTRQERELLLSFLKEIRIVGSGHLRATYREDASTIS